MLEVIGHAPELTTSAEADDQVQEKPILLAIDQYLGRAAKVKKLSCYVKYWREGKQEEAIPLLMYHGT